MELEHLNEEERKLIGNYIQEGVSALRRKQQAADELKDIADVVHERFETIEKAAFTDAVNTIFKATLNKKKSKLSKVEELIDIATETLPVGPSNDQ